MATGTFDMTCGCGMRCTTTELDHTNAELLSERLWDCNSTENSERHNCLTWWCNDCRHSEWKCQKTGNGRFCDKMGGSR